MADFPIVPADGVLFQSLRVAERLTGDDVLVGQQTENGVLGDVLFPAGLLGNLKAICYKIGQPEGEDPDIETVDVSLPVSIDQILEDLGYSRSNTIVVIDGEVIQPTDANFTPTISSGRVYLYNSGKGQSGSPTPTLENLVTKVFRIGTPDPIINDWVDEVVTFSDPKTIDELIATLPGINRRNCMVSSSTVQPLPRRVSVYTEPRNNEYISITYIGVSTPPEPTTGFDYILPFTLS